MATVITIDPHPDRWVAHLPDGTTVENTDNLAVLKADIAARCVTEGWEDPEWVFSGPVDGGS